MNYARMLGPGDLPGDSRHPNSPDYVEPAYAEDDAEDDAEGDVANDLIESGDVAELVADMRLLEPLLSHLQSMDLPWGMRAAAGIGLDKARLLDRMVEAKIQEQQS